MILDPRSSILDPQSNDPVILDRVFPGKNWLLIIKLNSPPYPPYPPYRESPGNSFLVFLGYPSRIRQKPGYHSHRSFQHGPGVGRMWLISISKDFLDVSKRTIVAKVKLFVYHIILFNLIHVMARKGIVLTLVALCFSQHFLLKRCSYFSSWSSSLPLMSLCSVVFDDDHLVAIILSNLAWFAWLVAIKYVF